MRFAHTYSIVAHEPETGRFGAAVQSHWFNVADVLWLRPQVGAIATQSLASFDYGPRILELLEQEHSPREALERLLAEDDDRDVRQIAVLTPDGVAEHTGKRCIAHAGHRTGDGYCAAANLMARPTVWDAMGEAFESTRSGLPQRLMAALEAAEAEGGDLRGRQSCSLVVVTGEPTGREWEDKVIDIRVDDHPEPLIELRRSLDVAEAYDHMIQGEAHLARRQMQAALRSHEEALRHAPDRPEIAFWTAVSYVAVGEIDPAIRLFGRCFDRAPHWRELVRRLVEPGILPDDENLIDRILSA